MPAKDKRESLLVQVGASIKYYRSIIAMSQTDLAEALEHSTAWLSLIENGRRQPSLLDLDKIAHKLGISINYFFIPPTLRPNAKDREKTHRG